MKLYHLPTGPYQAVCYIVIDEKSGETAVIDPGHYTAELKEALKNPEIKEIKYILLTHGHHDHILGVYGVSQDFPNAKICIHSGDEACLTDENVSLSCLVEPHTQKPTPPDINLKDGSKINFGDIELTVLHTPGHTPGSVCYMDEENRIIYTGDTLFCRTVGGTQFGRGSDEDLRESIKRLYNLEGDYKIYAGHGRTTTLQEEREKNRYMRKLYR